MLHPAISNLAGQVTSKDCKVSVENKPPKTTAKPVWKTGEYLQEKWENLNCQRDSSNNYAHSKVGYSVNILQICYPVPCYSSPTDFLCLRQFWLSHQSWEPFLNFCHSVGLGKNNYLVLANNRETEISLLFFTIAHFPCFSQIEQKMKTKCILALQKDT